ARAVAAFATHAIEHLEGFFARNDGAVATHADQVAGLHLRAAQPVVAGDLHGAGRLFEDADGGGAVYVARQPVLLGDVAATAGRAERLVAGRREPGRTPPHRAHDVGRSGSRAFTWGCAAACGRNLRGRGSRLSRSFAGAAAF